jgi:hypothetical protein
MRNVFLIAIAAFSSAICFGQKKDKHETIEGNGKLITRDVAVSSFDVLKASGVYELKLVQGDKEAVKIEADENLQEYFTVKNEGSKLVIDMEKLNGKNLNSKGTMKVYVTFKNLNSKGTMKVYVTFKKLKEMDLKMVGNVSSEKQLSFDDLDLKNKSVGNVDLDLKVNKLDFLNKSVIKVLVM